MKLKLAAIFVMAGLGSAQAGSCTYNGCADGQALRPELSLSVGALRYDSTFNTSEIYMNYVFGSKLGPFRPIAGASVTQKGGTWIGIGLSYTYSFARSHLYARASVMPGYYHAGNGPDLGYPLEFRSALELGYEADNGTRYGISVDHRSNANLGDHNPGMETVQFRVTVPLK